MSAGTAASERRISTLFAWCRDVLVCVFVLVRLLCSVIRGVRGARGAVYVVVAYVVCMLATKPDRSLHDVHRMPLSRFRSNIIHNTNRSLQ